MEPEQARQLVRETNYASWRAQRDWDPLFVVRAEGSRFWDAQGRTYLDFASQLVATNLGHGNHAVVEAIRSQASELAFAAPSLGTFARAELSSRLGQVMPPGLRRYFFSTSGTEANEAALAIARAVTGRRKILSRHRSYHGSTAGSISVSGDPRRQPREGSGTVPGALFAPDCYCYRCPLGLEYPSCRVACAEQVDEMLREDGDVAAMILEPIVGTNGVLVPVPEYLPRIREITRSHGVLLIADEVMTGWGRTGAWFAVDHWRVVPDLLTTAKGITGAYAPLALTASTPELHDAFRDRFFPNGHTYEAHPIGASAAVAAIGEYRRLGLIDRSRAEGDYLLHRLKEIQARHRSVGEVRGQGLFAAIELVRDRATREPFNRPSDVVEGKPMLVDELVRALRADGVYLFGWASHLIVAPPLIVERSELDRGLEAIDRVLSIADARCR